MRIFPLALIAIGVFGVLKHYGIIAPAFVNLFWRLLLIGMGAVILGSSLGGGSTPPVPEPGTIVAMAAGIAYLALRRRRT